jgi:hypothetical protein
VHLDDKGVEEDRDLVARGRLDIHRTICIATVVFWPTRAVDVTVVTGVGTITCWERKSMILIDTECYHRQYCPNTNPI